MKKYIIITLLLFSILPILKSQNDTSIKKEDIVGRWIEEKRIEGDNVKMAGEYADTYIFKDNMIYHKGEAAEGVILFNVAGWYEVQGDIISIFYNNYLMDKSERQKPEKMQFKILNLTESEMFVLVSDNGREYKMLLKK
ncbi:hypothetical protein [Prevotella sp. 10(H)]|uniref:hypothetical protein n=1 Tax=Prevotella sp. 10(H) TaxID=1158294 RepID=UPI000AF50AB9|nr:hypothetical protein [Prevotella sp. 10(H)]